jgi:plasmid stability protein
MCNEVYVMPTLIVENVPADIYDRLQKRAAFEHRTITDEMLVLLREVLAKTTDAGPRLPDLILPEEISAPYDLPKSSIGSVVDVLDGTSRSLDFEPLEIMDESQ